MEEFLNRPETAERLWSGSRPPPPPGEWFDGRGFWLNAVQGEELDVEDPRLTEEEKLEFGSDVAEMQCFELPITDPRCSIPASVNDDALCMADLNHDPSGLRSVLLTSFDLIEDVKCMQSELNLPRSVRLTLCLHPWANQAAQRNQMLQELKACFDDVVVHFPLGDATSGCLIHAKLLLLEFKDRLRVVITSANLKPAHWQFKNEVVWVQDFPRLAKNVKPDISRVLGCHFSKVFSCFLCDLLQNAACDRQHVWAAKLALFDFTGANAHLVPSRPGVCFPAPQHHGGLAILLRVECRHDCSGAAAAGDRLRIRRKRRLRRPWELHSVQSDDVSPRAASHFVSQEESRLSHMWRSISEWLRQIGTSEASLVGTFDRRSCATLGAAESMGFTVPSTAEVVSIEHSDDAAHDGGGAYMTTLLVRVVLDGRPHRGWHVRAASLLASIDLNHGLYALREHLSKEVWPQTEERHYTAIASSVESYDDQWFDVFDRCACRSARGRVSGPDIITPGGDGPIEDWYVSMAPQGRLAEHFPPWHAPGREFLRNHSKVIVRQFWDPQSQVPYGWVYVGSHNLTKSAWGNPSHDADSIWIRNRELGVLLMQPRLDASGSPAAGGVHLDAGNLFSRTPLPFLVPTLPADVSNREIVDTWREWEKPEDDDWRYDDSWWWGNNEDSRWWEDDEGWSDDEDDDSWERADWRLNKSAWWWWQ